MPVSRNYKIALVAAVAICERNGHASLADEILVSVVDDMSRPEGPAVIRPARALSLGEALTLCQVRRLIYVNVNGDPVEEYDDEENTRNMMAGLLRPLPGGVSLLPGVRWLSLAEAAREPQA